MRAMDVRYLDYPVPSVGDVFPDRLPEVRETGIQLAVILEIRDRVYTCEVPEVGHAHAVVKGFGLVFEAGVIS